MLYLAEAVNWGVLEVRHAVAAGTALTGAAQLPEREVLDGPAVALVSIMGNRMLLNLRRRHRADIAGTLTTGPDAISTTAVETPFEREAFPLDAIPDSLSAPRRPPSNASSARSMPWDIPAFLSYQDRMRMPPSEDGGWVA